MLITSGALFDDFEHAFRKCTPYAHGYRLYATATKSEDTGSVPMMTTRSDFSRGGVESCSTTPDALTTRQAKMPIFKGLC